MALRGKGVAWLPDCLVRTELERGELVAVNLELWRVPYQIRLYCNQSLLDPLAERFWQEIKQRVSHGWQLVAPFYC